MTELKSNVGRKIKAVNIDIAQVSYCPQEDEIIILEREEIHGDMSMRECYFAVIYHRQSGKERARFWLGENCQIFWED